MNQEKLKFLIIEHDAAFARYVGEMLGQARDLSAEVVQAEGLQQGLAALTAGPVDLVMADLALPDGAGLGNVSLIRNLAHEVPVIIAGESADETVALEAVQAGANDYLVKGQLTPAWLERSIRYAIERNRVARALLQAEEKYHNLFDHLVEGIFQTTPDGHYLMANAALARIYGYDSPEELIGTLTDITHRLYVQEGRRDEFVRLMQEHDVIAGFESQVYRKDGSIIWISENCRAIRDANQRLLHYEGTVEDITQRRQAEEKLLHSETLYHSLVETLPQNIFRKNLEHRFTFANQQFCRSLGRPLEEIVDKTDFDFFPPDLARKYQADDQRVIDTGQPYETVEEHRPPGQETIYVQVVKTPIRGTDGSIIGLQGIYWDITQQKMADERIRKVNAALTQSRKELRAKNDQMEEDLRMAQEIQLTMLPQQYPVFSGPGEHSEDLFQFSHRYLPTGSVGGDFFTISALSESQAAVFLCDVAGHGVRSALITAMIRALLEELKTLASSPGEFLTKLNSDLCSILKHTGTPVLTTAFYCVADAGAGLLRYSNAGHPKPLHVRRGAGQVLPIRNAWGKSQPALGLVDTSSYQTSEILLAPGDRLLIFTDGLVEVQNPAGDLYSQELLLAAVQRHINANAQQLLEALLRDVKTFAGGAAFTDDVCLVSMDYRGAGPAPTG
ncbi:MAG TPA: SpoIIE family protein phosphatase [Verrucomicrobiae bacterium]